MAIKYDPEKDYTKFRELAEQMKDIEDRLLTILDEKGKIEGKISAHIETSRAKIDEDLIKTAAHEYQIEILNEITQAVVDSGDLQKAVRLIDYLESHLEARLRLTFRGEEKPTEQPQTPTVSPAVAARKQLDASEKRAPGTAPVVTFPQRSATGAKAPPPPPVSSGKPGGRIAERRTVLNDRINEICRYEYDGNRLSRLVFLDAQGNPVRTHQMIYDKEGRLVQEIHIDRAGVTLQVFDRELDSEGRIKRETTRNAQNEILNTVDLGYDRKGRLVKKQWRDSRGKKTKAWEYKYDRDIKEPEKIVWRDERNRPYGYVELRYDDKGHIIAETSKDRDGDVIRSITYQYFYG